MMPTDVFIILFVVVLMAINGLVVKAKKRRDRAE